MKITKHRLKKIIKEEFEDLLEMAVSKKQAAAVKQLQSLVKAGMISQDEFNQKKAALLGQKEAPQAAGGLQDGGTLVEPADATQDPNVGGTLVEPGQGSESGNKKLALVAKELEVLLKKIQQEL